MFKKIFNCLKNKFTPKITYEITPKGQCFFDYLVKVQSGEKYDHIQAYDDTINETMQEHGWDRDKTISMLKVLLCYTNETTQND